MTDIDLAEFELKLEALLSIDTGNRATRKVVVYVANVNERAALVARLNQTELVAELYDATLSQLKRYLAMETFQRREKTKYLVGSRAMAIGWHPPENSLLVFWDPLPYELEDTQLKSRIVHSRTEFDHAPWVYFYAREDS